MLDRTATEVLVKASQILENARIGLEDLSGPDPTRRVAGLHNVVIWSRAVTNVLQTLRGVNRSRFDAWYAPFRTEMEGDPLLRYFYKMRTDTLKLGGPDVGSSTHIAYLNTADLEPVMANPPPGAESFFIGDDRGGSGWLVRLPDGTFEKQYVTMPPTLGLHTALLLPDPPAEHLGTPTNERSAAVLARMYYRYIENLVAEAQVEFADL